MLLAYLVTYMDLLIKFYSEENFCLTIKSLTQHQVLGDLKIGKSRGQRTYDVDGLVYQLNENIYYFTFSVNWECEGAPIFSTFTGELKLENVNAKSTLNLSWLHVNDISNASSCINGSSELTTHPVVKHLSTAASFPLMNKISLVN